jgi:ribonuclease HII
MTTPERIVGGIDEAGRGSVLGPLVVAGVSAGPEALKEFERLGVTDSKLLTGKARSELYKEIAELSAAVRFVSIGPSEIDHYVKHGRRYRKLNFLEAIHMATVISGLGAEEVFVDAPDTNPARFCAELAELLQPCPRLVAEHKADRNYVVVSAASIVAKVERDRAVEKLREVHGDFGSGYPSDDQTISYLKDWVQREGCEPPFARKSWKTWDRVFTRQLTL